MIKCSPPRHFHSRPWILLAAFLSCPVSQVSWSFGQYNISQLPAGLVCGPGETEAHCPIPTTALSLQPIPSTKVFHGQVGARGLSLYADCPLKLRVRGGEGGTQKMSERLKYCEKTEGKASERQKHPTREAGDDLLPLTLYPLGQRGEGLKTSL